MPRHLNSARFQVWLSQIQNTTPSVSFKLLRHSTVNGEILPSLIELVFFSLSAINVSANHWQFVEITPPFSSSSRNAFTAESAHCSGVPDSQVASKVSVAPVVVSACRDRLQPGDSDAFSPLKQSVYIHTSGRYCSILALTLSLTWLSILVDILLPAQVPLTRLMYPFSSRLSFLNFLTVGMTMWTCPPPLGRQPLFTIFMASQLSSWQWFLRQGMSWFWMVSTELSVGWLVRPWRWTFRAVLPVKAIRIRYSRQQAIERQRPQSKCSYTPSLLVTIPAQKRSRLPPLATMTLQPLQTASIIFRKRDYSGSRPGGWLWRFTSSRSRFCYPTSAQRSCCRNTRGSFLTSILSTRQLQQSVYLQIEVRAMVRVMQVQFYLKDQADEDYN